MPVGQGTSRRWNEEELEILCTYVQSHGPQFVSEILATKGYFRSRSGVGQTARLLGLYYEGPRIGAFPKGHVPKNKGKKTPDEIKKKSSAGWFKSGEMRGAANQMYKPIGGETIRQDGYTWVKIAEKTWRVKHQLIWEKQNGPVPAGHIVAFRDGNPHNFLIDNLELITKAENLRRNRFSVTPSEYSLITNRAAKVRLKKAGVLARDIRANPELLEIAKSQTLLKLKIRKQRHDTSR